MLGILTDAEVAGAIEWEPVVSSWLGTRWLGDVPVSDGSVTWSIRREVQGSLDLTVPRWAPEHHGWPFRDWLPRDDDHDHPLAALGQVLTVAVRVTALVSRRSWLVPQGRMLITRCEDNGGTVSVTGVSLLQRVADDPFASPMPTRVGGTLASEARRLVPASLSVMIDAALVDRAVPEMSWDESRMEALADLATAWPARLREDGEGMLRFLPPLPDIVVPALTLTDGIGGTVVSAYGSQSRDGIYNCVVARGQDAENSDEPGFQAEAIQEQGPYAVSRFGVVRKFYSSPLLTSLRATSDAASSILAESIRPARTLPVSMAADPRVQLDDPVCIITDAGTPQQRSSYGYVSGYTLPLTHDGGGRLDVEVV